MGLIRRRTHLPSLAVGALAVVVLAAGSVSAAVVGRRPVPASTSAATGTLGLSQLAGARAEAGGPAVPSTTSAPTTAVPSTAAPKAADPLAAPPLPGHRTPGAVVAPFQSGRTEWAGVSNGITMRVVMTPGAPRAGETVTFVVEASMPSGLCCGLMLQSGDGGGDQYPPPPGFGPAPCSAQEPKASSVRGELRHAYNKAGRWNFSVSARSGGVCVPSASVYGSIDGTIQVGTGVATPSPQGPSAPTIRPASVYPYEPQVITLVTEARDEDGFIDRMVVDWGDGSATETYKNPQPCKTMSSGWPAGSYTVLPLWMGVGPVTHRYRDGRPYTVTVTAISTSCERTGEQRVSGSIVFPEPVAAPPPIASLPLPPTSNIPPPPPISSIPVPPPGPPPALPVIVTTTVPAR